MGNKKKRADCYFGIHFDFHANEKTKGIGTKTKPENIGMLLDEVKPDYVQVDTKGHPGLASFFSSYGDIAPGLEIDHLKIIREETQKRNIGLYAHYSGIYERKVCRTNPEWAVMNRDGSLSSDSVDPLSEYADKKLIPQLKELCGRYRFDGAWIDGECWAVRMSWRPEELEKFYQITGFDKIDEDVLSESYLAYVEFWEENFRQYVKHYIAAVHEEYPDFQIADNFMFSHHMPEKPFKEIDYLSGDSVGYETRITPRCFAGMGKPWDMMSWAAASVYVSPDPSFFPTASKHIERICREAAMAISQGGGYQIVNAMTPQGEIRMYDIKRLKKLSEFVYERKEINFKSQPLENAAFLVSEYNNTRKRLKYSKETVLFPKTDVGICDTVLDGGLPCDIIYEYQIEETNRHTIIIPEFEFVSEDTKQKLKHFTDKGGNFIVCGRHACKLFSDMAAADMIDFDGYMVYTEQNGSMFGMHEAILFEKHGAEDVANCYRDSMTPEAEKVSSIISNRYGDGRVVFIGMDIISDYSKHHCFEESELMCGILKELEKPAAYLESGIKRAEIIPAEKDGMTIVNVINTTEFYCDDFGNAMNEIPPICDLTIAVKCKEKPKCVILEPAGEQAEFTYDGTYAHVKVEKLHIHTAIVIR